MGKQPYIPFYIGDYIRDTRILPLNVRGGWVEIIIQSWDSGGEISGTIEEFARMLSCSTDECNLVIQTLKQKKIFDYLEGSDGVIKITVRKIKKIIELSQKRKISGKSGGNPKLLKKKVNYKLIQKDNQNPEIENEYENEIIIEDEKLKLKFKEWRDFRKSKGKPISKQAAKKQVTFLKKYSIPVAIEIIEQSIMNDWQGLFELKQNGTHKQDTVPSRYNAGEQDYTKTKF